MLSAKMINMKYVFIRIKYKSMKVTLGEIRKNI